MSNNQQPIPPNGTDGLWDALKVTHESAVAYMTQAGAVTPLLRDTALVALIEDQQALHDQSGILARDVREFVERLNAIRDKHQSRSGGTRNQTEWMETIQINEEYIEWIGSFTSVVMPTVTVLLEMFQAAIEKQKALQAAPAPEAATQE